MAARAPFVSLFSGDYTGGRERGSEAFLRAKPTETHEDARLTGGNTTYQRLMDRILAPMLGQNVQAYVDDMVVTLEEKDWHIADL